MGQALWLEEREGRGEEAMAEDAKGGKSGGQSRGSISPEVRILLIGIRRAILCLAKAIEEACGLRPTE